MSNTDIYDNNSEFKADLILDSILEPLSQEMPLNVERLSAKFSEMVWKSYGNSSSKEYIELWSIIFSKLNECERRNCQTQYTYNKYFVIPAPTGSGKTQCLRFYAAELYLQNKDIGMVILSKFKSEVDEAVEQINRLAGDTIAIGYYTGTDVKGKHNEDELDNYQVVVTTHQYFKLNHHKNAVDKSTYRKVMSFNGHTRDIVVVDEAIDLMDTYTITRDLISKLETKAVTLTSKSNSPEVGLELKLLTYLNDNYKTLFFDDEIETSCRYVGDKLPLLQRISLELNESIEDVKRLFNLHNFIQALQSKRLDKVDMVSPSQKTVLIKYAREVVHLLDDSVYWYYNQKYISSSLEEPTVSTVLFDATANIDNLYNKMSSVTIVQPLPEVKRYDNVVLNYKKLNIGLGKDSISKNTKAHFDNLALLYCNIKHPNWEDRIVIFTRKALREYAEYNEIPSSIDHFGNLVGVNHYKDDNHILIYGINHKPASLSLNNLYQAIGNDAFDNESEGLLAELRHSNISAEIIQAINRGRCRKVANGQAPEAHIYLALAKRDKQLNVQILSDIKKAMPGITIREWDVDASAIKGQSQRKVDAKFDLLLEDMQDLSNHRSKLSSLSGYKALSSKEQRTATTHLMSKDSALYGEMQSLGYKCIKEGQYYLIKN